MTLYLRIASLAVIFRLAVGDIFAFSKASNTTIREFRDEPAQFGPLLPPTGVRMEAVPALPENGCTEIQSPPNRDFGIKWVVVIARNNCTFEVKVRNAQKAGYAAAIVHNVGSNNLEPMSASHPSEIHIPSVFVGEMTGLEILNEYTYDKEAYLLLTGETFNSTNLIVAFSILAGLCFILMIVFMIVKHIRETRRLQRHRLPAKLLKKIPSIKFAKCHPYETCVICLEDFVEGDKLRILPCSHAYHCSCIDRWLTKSRRVCPICKRRVFAEGERRRRTSSESMSETETDDTTPLINPVGSSSNNHGTFSQRVGIASINEARSSSSEVTSASETQPNISVDNERNRNRTPLRVNPFDRVPNLPPNLVNISNESSEPANARYQWFHALRNMFRNQEEGRGTPRGSSTLDHLATMATSRRNDDRPTIVNVNVGEPSQPENIASMPSQPTSNNILNANLSGSFKDNSDNSDENNELNGTESTRSSSANQQQTQQVSTQGRLGVAAIPNTNFNPLAPPDRRSNRRNRRHFMFL